ncbi:MAG TPA: methyltransferase domain-containing protein [Bacteroidia bacterium]|nr:methyltransferase domain-containing protein [Bacteroidia bacterium]HNU33863.1 methyltransferase domain-containing protein [Bacteroidia bacterium]
MKSKQNKISTCRICNSMELQTVILLPQMPLTDEFITKENIGKEFLGDIQIAVCGNCGCSQNLNDTDMDDYYNEYTYSVQSSGFAIQFMKTLAERVKSNFFKSVSSPKVIEIGSGTGEQLLEFKKLGFEVLGVEPSKKLVDYANNIGIPTLHAFFDEHIKDKLPADFQKVDLILSSYTFDHIPQPVSVLKEIHSILRPGGLMIHEVHDLDLIKKRNEYCLFEHEHYTYLNERTMSYVVGINGFEIHTYNILSQNEKRANSLLVVAKKIDTPKKNFVDLEFELAELKLLNANVKESIARIQTWLEENSTQKVVAYGAGGRGIMTIAALSDSSAIKYIVDKNPKAQNIFAPKSHLPVYGLEELGRQRADKILVFSFGYYNEIVSELGEKFNYKPEQFTSLLDLLELKHA